MTRLLLVFSVITTASVTASATSSAFDGFYVGVGAGGVRSKTKTDVTETTDNLIGRLNRKSIPVISNKISNGFLSGIYSGYGKSFKKFYFGCEISISSDFTKRQLNLVNAADPDVFTLNYAATTKYKRGIIFGIAPRLGYVFGNNLLYVKPGFEISRDQVTAIYNGTNSARPDKNVSVSESTRKTNMVFTPAFGYERAYGRIILRGEYSYNPGKKVTIFANNTRLSGYDNASYSDHRLMVGVAYKF